MLAGSGGFFGKNHVFTISLWACELMSFCEQHRRADGDGRHPSRAVFLILCGWGRGWSAFGKRLWPGAPSEKRRWRRTV
jgi:hypothetical protein